MKGDEEKKKKTMRRRKRWIWKKCLVRPAVSIFTTKLLTRAAEGRRRFNLFWTVWGGKDWGYD